MENYLFEQNLHWQQVEYDAGVERFLLKHMLNLMDTDQILTIGGIRRCGKSFLLKQIINQLVRQGVPQQNILFVNLELPAFVGQPAHEVLDLVMDTYLKLKTPENKLYIFLDELQTVEGWETWIKYQYDLNKGKMKFIITGSNSQLLSGEFASLLSGRIIENTLYPFAFGEILDLKDINWRDQQDRYLNRHQITAEFDQTLKYGGMPETIVENQIEVKRELLASYFNAILYKDIIPRFSVREGTMLNELAIYLLGQTSGIVNLKKVANYFHTSRSTIREFVGYLSLAFLIYLLPKFSFSAKTREMSLKKCYALDTGFANLLPIRFSPDQGKLLENVVLIELLRQKCTIFYHRNHYECDFMVRTQQGRKMAIQVCHNLTPANQSREFKGLNSGGKQFNADDYLVLTMQTDKNTIDKQAIKIKPVYEWILENTA